MAVKTASTQRVLYLGDSMSMGEFGRTMDRRMRDAGMDVYTYVAGGATPYYWLSRFKSIASDIGYWHKTPKWEARKRYLKAVPKVEYLVKTYNPDIVVVQTGTNLYSQLRSKRRSKEDNIAEVEKLCRDMAKAVSTGGRRCYWITPPRSHVERFSEELQAQMAEIVKRVVSPYGRVFDSRTVTEFVDPYPETDGIHYGATEARQWANYVAGDFIQYTGGVAISRKALDPEEAFGDAVPVIKKAVKVAPGTVRWGEIDIKMRLKRKTELPHVSEITYQNCLVLFEYEVLDVKKGYYPYDTIRVAHLGVYKRKPTSKSRYKVGATRQWRMMPIETYAFFERLQMADDLEPDLDKPIYVIKQD